jgi:hypothetical protein
MRPYKNIFLTVLVFVSLFLLTSTVVFSFGGPPAAPTVNVTATPNPIAYNGTSNISWQATSSTGNTISCDSNGHGTGATGNFDTPNLTSDTTYSVSCSVPACQNENEKFPNYNCAAIHDAETCNQTGANGGIGNEPCRWETSGNGTGSATVTVTPLSVPTLNNPTSSNVIGTGATLGANIVSGGNPLPVSARGFCYTSAYEEIPVTLNEPYNTCVTASAPTSPYTGTYSVNLTGLTPNTVYWYSAYATNSTGTGYTSSTGTFTTSQITCSASASPSTISSGDTSTITWSTTGTTYLDHCNIAPNNNPGNMQGPSGHFTVTPTTTTTYPIVCTPVGNQPPTANCSCSTTVTVANTPTVNLTVTDVKGDPIPNNTVAPNTSVLVSWTSTNAYPNPPSSPVGCSLTSPTSLPHQYPGSGQNVTFISDPVNTATTFSVHCDGPGGSGTNGANASETINVFTTNMPDLTAYPSTPTTATVGTPVTLSALIKNIGNASTVVGFNNFIQISLTDQNSGGNNGEQTNLFFPVALAANGGGQLELINLSAVPMGPLDVNASATTSHSYTFTTAGNYWVRACADKSSPGSSGVIQESNENNNCGYPWTEMTVTNPNGNQADLTAGPITPTVAQQNVPVTFSSTISNIGTAPTGIGFPNFFQVSNNGGITSIDLSAITLPAMGAGGSAPITKTYTPTVAGTFWVRACANKYNRNQFGLVQESNYNNNCTSPWTVITVVETGQLCTDKKAVNYGLPLPCLYKSGLCLDPTANNYGQPLPCTYTTPPGECANGATNPPDCTLGGDGTCLNGATNPPDCTLGGDGTCLNGAINPPECTIDTNKNCIDPKATNEGSPAPCHYKKTPVYNEN